MQVLLDGSDNLEVVYPPLFLLTFFGLYAIIMYRVIMFCKKEILNMDNNTKGLHAEFNYVIETKLNKAIADYMDNEDDFTLLGKISLYSSILRNLTDIARINQQVEFQNQMADYVSKIDPSVMEGLLGKFSI